MGEIQIQGPGPKRSSTRHAQLRGPFPAARSTALLTEEGTFVDDLLGRPVRRPSCWRSMRPPRRISPDPGPRDRGVAIDDVSDATALLAPRSPLGGDSAGATEADLGKLLSFRLVSTTVAGAPGVVSRTGYTGEDGLRFVAAGDAERVWSTLLAAGRERGLVPVGLGARLLAPRSGLCLRPRDRRAGHPVGCGSDWVVKLEDRDFVGRDALLRQRRWAPRRLVGLELAGRRIGRRATVWGGDEAIGRVTSGTWTPYLEQSIAMALVGAGHSVAGAPVEVEVRDSKEGAAVRGLPFYRRQRPRRTEGVDVS
jgi:aminomethyltransferase